MTHHPPPTLNEIKYWWHVQRICASACECTQSLSTVCYLHHPIHVHVFLCCWLFIVHTYAHTHTRTPDLNTVNIRIQVDIPKLVYFMNMKVFFSWSWERMIPNNQNCHLPHHDHNSNMLRMINSNRNNHCSLFTLTMDNSIQMVYNTITYRITEMYTGKKWFLLQSL